ncbi:MAG: hypothetical protein R2705_09410 [Ilumatobacteraceae bacterium]
MQESLSTNAVEHGGPDVSVEVTLDHGANGLTISVADEGLAAARRPERSAPA